MFGWSGQILHIDLTKKKVVKEQTAPHAKEFIGGRGINIELLYKGIKPGIDPLSPENILILGTGPLTGTAAPSSSRTEVTSKSPLTGFWVRQTLEASLELNSNSLGTTVWSFTEEAVSQPTCTLRTM